MLLRYSKRLMAMHNVTKPENRTIVTAPTHVEEMPESLRDVELVNKNDEEFSLKIKTKVIDYEYFYSSNNFAGLDALCQYIRYRNDRLTDKEIYHILDFIETEQWMETFMTSKLEEMKIIADRLSSLYFATFDLLYMTFFKACGFGLLTYKEVILNFLLEINRLCFSGNKARYLELTYSNAYNHNYKNFLTNKFEVKKIMEVGGLDDFVGQVQVILRKKDKTQSAYPNEYKEVYIEFDEAVLLGTLSNNAKLIDRILDIVDYIYKQFSLNNNLIFEKIESSYAYKNFELNFGKCIPHFKKDQILRYINIIYKNIVVLQDDLNIPSHSMNILTAILGSEKITLLDLAIFDIWTQLTAKEMSFYIYLLGRMGYTESVFNVKMIDILEFFKLELGKNFVCFSILVFGLGRVGPIKSDVWRYIDNFATLNYFALPALFSKLPSKPMKTFIMTIAKMEHVTKVWGKTDKLFMLHFGFQFSEVLAVLQRRFVNNWTTNADLSYLDEFNEFRDTPSHLVKLQFKDFIETMQFVLYFWQEHGIASHMHNKETPNFIERVAVEFADYLKTNKKEISSLPVSSHIHLIDISAHLAYIIKNLNQDNPSTTGLYNLDAAKDQTELAKTASTTGNGVSSLPVIENSFLVLRNQLNALSKTEFLGEEEANFILIYHVYLRLGYICSDMQYSHDSYEFFRRKFYKHIVHDLRYVNYKSVLHCLEMTFYYNYVIDSNVIDLLAFRIMLDLEKYSLKELNHIVSIYHFWLTSEEIGSIFEQYTNLRLKDSCEDLIIALLYQIMRIIENSEWHVGNYDQQQIELAKELIQASVDIYNTHELKELYQRIIEFTQAEDSNLLPALLKEYNISTEFSEGENPVGLYTRDEVISRAVYLKQAARLNKVNCPSNSYQILHRYQREKCN